MQGVERLSIVSKVLFDSRLIELRRENEALKLKLFWSNHNKLALKQHLAWANGSEVGPNCRCGDCLCNGRIDLSDHVAEDGPVYDTEDDCTFIPWFENEIVQFDMTISFGSFIAVTTHFATDCDGGIEFGDWLLQIPTCKHPDQEKV
jgi:hypothetical protein